MLSALRQFFYYPAFASFVICGMLLTAAPVSANQIEIEYIYEGRYICGHAPPLYPGPVGGGCSSPSEYTVFTTNNHVDPFMHTHGILVVSDGHCPAGTNQVDYQCAEVCDLAHTFASNAECFSRSANKNILDKDMGTPTTCPATYGGDPINFSTGNLVEVETDYQSQGDFPLSVVRTYNSNTGIWIFNHQLSISPIVAHYRAPYDSVIDIIYQASAMRADGKKLLYDMVGVTRYSSSQSGLTGATRAVDADMTDKLVAGLDGSKAITGWTYTRTDSDVVETYYADGKLHTETNRAGIQHTYTYTGTPVTDITVEHSNGSTIVYTLDSGGKITGFTVGVGGKSYSYAYSGTQLTSVAYPDEDSNDTNNPQRIYAYKTGTNYLETVTDENNHVFTSWVYSGAMAISSQHAGGADLTTINYANLTTPTGITYPDEDGNVTVTNALNQQTTYFFKTILGVRKIVRVVGENNASCATAGKAYTYNTSGFLTSKTDWNGNKTTYTPDTKGRETVRVEASLDTTFARTITTGWDTGAHQYNVPKTITESGRVTGFTYKDDGTIESKTVTAAAKSRVWLYDSTNGQITKVRGPRNIKSSVTDTTERTIYEYYASGTNNNGNLYTITNAKGQITTFSDYNARGQPTKKLDANGVETVYDWYARGWLKSITVHKPGGTSTDDQITQYNRDNVGQLTQLTRPDGSVVGYEYDDAHRLHAITDGYGGRMVYIRDFAGNVTSETIRKDATSGDSSGIKVQSLTRGYDDLSRLIWLKNDAGRKTVSYTYDANGNVETVKRWGDTTNPSSSDDANLTTTYGYDALNRLSTVTDPAGAGGGVTHYEHDALDHITQIIDANTIPTTYTVNGLDELTELLSRDSGTTKFTGYDEAGNVTQKIMAFGTANDEVVIDYTYDELNRIATVDYPDTDKDLVYTYDNASGDSCNIGHGYVIGRLCRVTRGSGSAADTLDYSYDYLGNVVQEVHYPLGSSGIALTTGFVYENGHLKQTTYPDGRVVNNTRTDDHLTSLATTFNSATATLADQIGYRALGGIETNRFTSTSAYSWQHTQWLDADGRYAQLLMQSTNSDWNTSRNYMYDAFDNIFAIERIDNDIDAKHEEYFEYDGLQRLTRADGPYGSYTYSYDATGNRTGRTRYAAGASVPTFSETYAYPASPKSNRLTSVTRTDGGGTPVYLRRRDFEYDGSGNLKTDHRKKCDNSSNASAVTSNKTLNLIHGKSGRFDSVTVTDHGTSTSGCAP